MRQVRNAERNAECRVRKLMGVVLFALAVTPLLAAPPADNTPLKRQMQDFERALNQSIIQMFGTQFFVFLQEPKAAYLPGFGVVVHAEVNLHPMRFIMPFAPQPYSEQELKTEREQKLARMKVMQKGLQDLLLAQGRALTQLSGEEQVAVVIHLYNPRTYPEIPSQVLLQARRQALLDVREREGKPDPIELAKAINLREF